MAGYERSVFVNCPFDSNYEELFSAIVFAVYDCGYAARSVLEFLDAGATRISKLMDLVSKCKLGIHDLSRVELDGVNNLPRFNMPLELGIFLGAQHLGTKKQREKSCLVFEKEPYRYQKFCSDISGQDVTPHDGAPREAIRAVRNWLSSLEPSVIIPGGSKIFSRYEEFLEDLPLYRESFDFDDRWDFRDFRVLVSAWLNENAN